MSASATCKAARSSLELRGMSGLSQDEARRRLDSEGLNELPTEKPREFLAIALEVAREPMFLMLVAAGSLYLVMGEPADAAMLIGFVLVVMAITIIQERRTERALDALRDSSSPRALVIRDGVHQRIPGREVVRGDLVVLSEGDRVPADGLLRRGINLSTDESLLTGESVPVRKVPSAVAQALDKPGGDDLPTVFSSTLVTAGQGLAEVISTGGRTEIGKIGKAATDDGTRADASSEGDGSARAHPRDCGPEPVFRGSRRLCADARQYDTLWKQGFLAGIAMAMAMLPEEFPVVLTIFLALGAWRISRSTRAHAAHARDRDARGGNGAVRRQDRDADAEPDEHPQPGAARGGASTLCTLPAARFRRQYHGLLEFGMLASKADPFDPMEKAIRQLGGDQLRNTEHLHEGSKLAARIPAVAGDARASHVWRRADGREVMVACKGRRRRLLTCVT